jgi:hypothetical protein
VNTETPLPPTMTPTYADNYGDGADGWEVERWGPPKLKGCVWLRLHCDASTFKTEPIIDIT